MRLPCPFCGSRDHHGLGYFQIEEQEGKLRVATCENCRGYIKTTTTLSALSVPQLLVVDVATVHLDLLAMQRGYHGQGPVI